MKKLVSFVLLTIGLVAGPVSPADAATSVEKVPFDTTLEACGQTISLSGTLLVTSTVQQLHHGGFLVAEHFQPQGIRGTSTSGATYHATGLTRDITVSVPSGGASSTHINRFHIVGTAGAPSFSVKETVHTTVSASGDVRVSIDHFSETCS
jgi:hypothetical protein